jgi:hypothetical protein
LLGIELRAGHAHKAETDLTFPILK